MALYQTGTHWSDISLILPSLRTLLSSGDSSGTLLNLSNPIILTSTSLDRLSFADPAPSFPSGHQPPLFTLIDLQEENRSIESMPPLTVPCHEERIIVSTPTIPRMKALLEEKLVVDKWTDEVRPQTPPDHVPWGSPGTMGICSERDPIPIAYDRIGTPNIRQDLAHPPDLKASRRNALVLDGSISYASNRTAKQQSRGVKALALTQHEKQGFPHVSVYPTAPRRHPNLAIRRGRKALPSLKLSQISNGRKRRDTAPSDSIPTAFRGSPTAYCSPIWPYAHHSTSQNLALAEMLESLREKCASLSSRVLLPPDWFYRPRSQAKDLTKLPDTASSELRSDEDEWAFAEPLMDMINSFSTQVDNSGTHSIELKDDILELPILSRVPSDTIGLQAEELSRTSGPPACYLPVRPSLIGPTSLRTVGRGTRKNVRFAEAPVLFLPKDRPTVTSDECTTPSLPKVGPPKRQSVILSAWMPPTPPLSVVRSLQSAKPSRNSWSNTLPGNSLRSPPPPPRRPLSHRYPTAPKLPSFINGNTVARTLSGSQHQQSSVYKPPSDIVGKSPSVHSPSTLPQSWRKQTFLMKGKKTQAIKENLKISHPIRITAIPRLSQRPKGERAVDPRGNKNHINGPLRGIFMKLK